jgi:hypothetical protein
MPPDGTGKRRPPGRNGDAPEHGSLAPSVRQPADAGPLEALAPGFGTGFQAGYEHGIEVGYEQAEADMAAAWRAIAEPVSRGRSLVAEGWERRVASALAESRRAAWAHWFDFGRRAPGEVADADRRITALRAAGRDQEAWEVFVASSVFRSFAEMQRRYRGREAS